MLKRVRVRSEAVGLLNENSGPVRAGLTLYAIHGVIHPSPNIPGHLIQVVQNVRCLSLTTLCVSFSHRRFTSSVLLAELYLNGRQP